MMAATASDYMMESQNGNTPGTFSTLVFLDFEATGLLNSKPKITELCLLAVNRIDLLDATVLPRVTNKLVLCLDPQKPIPPTASGITGLYNDSLEHQKSLSVDTVHLINNFLNHLAQPVCLLAHNGNNFDFPLLMTELNRINQSLDSHFFCADTLEAFRELDGLPRQHVLKTYKQPEVSSQSSGNVTNHSFRTPPNKSADSLCPPVVKRKAINDLQAFSTTKQLKINDCGLGGHTEKVKKQLNFGQETVSEGSKPATQQSNEDEKPLFSNSLEDSDYLMALEMAEEDLDKTKDNDIERDFNLNATDCQAEAAVVETCIQTKLIKPNTEAADDEPKTEAAVDELNMKDAVDELKTEAAVSKPNTKDLVDELKAETAVDKPSTEGNKHAVSVTGENVTLSHTFCVSSGSGYIVRQLGDKSPTPGTSNDDTGSVHIINTAGLQETMSISANKLQMTSSSPKKNSKIIDRPSPSSNSSPNTSYKSSNSSPNTSYTGKSSNASHNTGFKSYKLEQVYFRTFGVYPPNTHSAEADCVAVMKIAKQTNGFIAWVESNAVLLTSLAT